MNKKERIELVRAMETIARSINDEEIIENWLTNGIPDGAIDENTTDEQLVEYVENDNRFTELMTVFLDCMEQAQESGGLYCDDVVSKN